MTEYNFWLNFALRLMQVSEGKKQFWPLVTTFLRPHSFGSLPRARDHSWGLKRRSTGKSKALPCGSAPPSPQKTYFYNVQQNWLCFTFTSTFPTYTRCTAQTGLPHITSTTTQTSHASLRLLGLESISIYIMLYTFILPKLCQYHFSFSNYIEATWLLLRITPMQQLW